MIIALSDKIPGSKNFTWYDALRCNQWGVHVFPTSQEVYLNIIKTAKLMDRIEDLIGYELIVTRWLSPEKYNALIGGAQASAHIQGLAVDFVCKQIPSPEIRVKLKDKLSEWEFRMEKLDTPHVHIDGKPPGPSGRYFKP